MPEPWVGDVLAFWFGLTPEQWWKGDAALDDDIRDRFLDLWREQQGRGAVSFLSDADTALAAVILFDQFPRNMFRGHADSFATDHLALAIARQAIARGHAEQIGPDRRAFLYMPFEHSERLDDQQQALLLFTQLGDPTYLAFARKHLEVIERFGRFPHRNAMLGREPRPDEIAAGDVDPTRI